jgi:peptidoglycan/xylan/chitin deacetylase (PgdA/CDA1 family)
VNSTATLPLGVRVNSDAEPDGYRQNRLKTAAAHGLELLLGTSPLLPHVRRRYGGRGVALMFHEICDDPRDGLGAVSTIAQLERVVRHLRETGRDIVTLDEAVRRLSLPSSPPFAVLTFDDGFRDTLTRVLPLLERFSAPFAVYVPSGMIRRDIFAWWLGLRHLLLMSTRLEFPPLDCSFELETDQQKRAALTKISEWIGQDFCRAELLRPLFQRHQVNLPHIVDDVALNADELRQLSKHPLVTVGAHTVSHSALATLPAEAARAELVDNRADLQELTQQPVNSLAYPYGSRPACGPREFQFAEQAGFTVAMTTRRGALFPQHLDTPCAWPREDVSQPELSEAAIAAHIAGVGRAVQSRWGNPVATV